MRTIPQRFWNGLRGKRCYIKCQHLYLHPGLVTSCHWIQPNPAEPNFKKNQIQCKHTFKIQALYSKYDWSNHLNDWDIVVIDPEQLQVQQMIEMTNLCDLVGIEAKMTEGVNFFYSRHRLDSYTQHIHVAVHRCTEGLVTVFKSRPKPQPKPKLHTKLHNTEENISSIFWWWITINQSNLSKPALSPVPTPSLWGDRDPV